MASSSRDSLADSSSPSPKRPGKAPRERPERSVPTFVLDIQSVANADGLAQEVAVLRASIRQLASNSDMAAHVKVLAELRHQIEALCRALKAQQALEGHDGGARAEMARVLEELGDELGVPR